MLVQNRYFKEPASFFGVEENIKSLKNVVSWAITHVTVSQVHSQGIARPNSRSVWVQRRGWLCSKYLF